MIAGGFLRRAAGAVTIALALAAAGVSAQEAAPASETVPLAPADDATAAMTLAADPAAADAVTGLAAGTLIEIRIEEAVNSKTHKTGDWYAIVLSQPIMLGDRTLVPAGTPGRGQVVHSAKSSWGGKAGELILAARYLEYEGRRIPLRGMKLGGVGGNNEGLAFAASVAGGLVATPLVFALNGKNADIPAGMLATAKLAEPLPAAPAVAAALAEPAQENDGSTMKTGEQK